MLFAETVAVLIVTTALIETSYGSIATGPCSAASKGGVFESCEMNCKANRHCSETINTETCGCDGFATYTSETDNYENGRRTTSVGRRKKRQTGDLNTCSAMSRRCKYCKNDRRAGSASAEKSKSGPCRTSYYAPDPITQY